MSIQFLETVGIDTDRAHGNNVLHVSNCSGNTGNSMKMPWLCKMCDVRVCIVLTVMVAIAFIAIIIAILILMN